MLPNFPTIAVGGTSRMGGHWIGQANMHLLDKDAERVPYGYFLGREVDHEVEGQLQRRWIREVLGSYRKLFGSPDAPVVCVRGNHCFTDLSEAFGGDVWEVTLDPSRSTDVCGLKVGGCRGIRYILGEWSDELRERGQSSHGTPVKPPAGDFFDVVRQLPGDLDVLITHAPPAGIMDEYGAHWGSEALRGYIDVALYGAGRLQLHAFGHVHEKHGQQNIAGVVFSNAATTHNIIDL